MIFVNRFGWVILVIFLIVSCSEASRSPLDDDFLQDPAVIKAFQRLQKVRLLRERKQEGHSADEENDEVDQKQEDHFVMKRETLALENYKELIPDEIDLSGCKYFGHKRSSQPKLLVLMMDAFRYDYYKLPEMSGLRKFLSTASKPPFVTPIFPSKTYPNMFSQVTGMFAESHGVVGNSIFDREHNELFLAHSGPDEKQGIKVDVNGTNSFWWNQSTPIWTTAEKQGIKAGIFYWEGCQTEIQGIDVTFCKPYESLSRLNWTEYQKVYENHILQAMKKFRRNEWSLSMIYLEAVDHAGHADSFDSDYFKEALEVTDNLIHKILKLREDCELESQLNIVLLSDHGMTFSPFNDTRQWVNVSDYLSSPEDSVPNFGSDIVVSLFPKDRKTFIEMYVNLTRAEIQGGCKVYAKGLDMPSRFHIENNDRTSEIMIVADDGWAISYFQSPWVLTGTHGYDPETSPNMRAFFAGNGPAFKKGFVSQETMVMTDHYVIFCHILKIEKYCHDNNGSWSRVKDLFDSEWLGREDLETNSIGHKTSVRNGDERKTLNDWKSRISFDSFSGQMIGIFLILVAVLFTLTALVLRRRR